MSSVIARAATITSVGLFILAVLSVEARERPNLILILADDLGYGDLGCYGSKINETPHLDRLADGGMRFTDFHSNGPMCTPTRAALLTGFYQHRFGPRFETALSGKNQDRGLPLEAVTIAELLRENGYATACFGKWHLGYGAPWLPTNQGFDEFRGLVSGDGDFHTQIDRSGNEDWWYQERLNPEAGYTTDLITNHGVDFIERHQEEPFFLYLPHLAVHFPWQGPDDPPHREAGNEYHRDKWGIIPDRSNVRPHLTAMIESLDDSVGTILAKLEELDLTENTLVVFTSDNGGYLNYSGGFENISEMGSLRGQKTDIYEGGHRVPAIASWPGKIEPSVSDETIMTFDLFATFAHLGDVPVEKWADCEGVNLEPLLFEQQAIGERTLFWRAHAKKAVREGDFKLCVLPGREPELFDLSRDLGETQNLAKEMPELVTDLQQKLAAWEQSVNQSAETFQ